MQEEVLAQPPSGLWLFVWETLPNRITEPSTRSRASIAWSTPSRESAVTAREYDVGGDREPEGVIADNRYLYEHAKHR
jgi:hypothetical protein